MQQHTTADSRQTSRRERSQGMRCQLVSHEPAVNENLCSNSNKKGQSLTTYDRINFLIFVIIGSSCWLLAASLALILFIFGTTVAGATEATGGFGGG